VLTAAERPRSTASRIRGKGAIVRSLRGLLLRVHRFRRGRARTESDIRWAAAMLDGLAAVLAVAEAQPTEAPSPDAPEPGASGPDRQSAARSDAHNSCSINRLGPSDKGSPRARPGRVGAASA
jgi:hypothetical protein